MQLLPQKEGMRKEERKEKKGKECERNLSRTIEQLIHFPRRKKKKKKGKREGTERIETDRDGGGGPAGQPSSLQEKEQARKKQEGTK